MTAEFPRHSWFSEPRLSFNVEKADEVDAHPLRGLVRFGPFSRNLVSDPIRIATLSPHGEGKKLQSLIAELGQFARATERAPYLIDWPGFEKVFRLRLSQAASDCHLEFDVDLEASLTNPATSARVLADRIERTLPRFDALRSRFDIIFIYLPVRWKSAYQPTPDDFDLHDHVKAVTALRHIPCQLIREDKALAYSHRASVMWRIGLALYSKAGGIPWKLADVDAETAYIGLSYAVRVNAEGQTDFITCCSQVFDAEGSGMEFVAFNAREVEMQGRNPFLSKNEMFRVMARSLDLYQRRHAGQAPKKIIVHKTTEFRIEEIEGCMQAFHLCEQVDLVQIVEEVGWRGIKMAASRDPKKPTQPAMYPVERGTLVPISPREALLWLHGDVANVVGSGPFFQGKKSTPRPLRIVRHAGHGAWDETARSMLALSKMDWNNDALYDPLPVTIGYAKVLARVIKRMPELGSTPYQFRFFM